MISGVLTRSRGDFDGDPRGVPTCVVELIGGIEPAREYVLDCDARRHGRGQRQQAAPLPARRGAVRGRSRAGRAAALRGRRGRRGAGRPRAAGVAGRPRRSSAFTGSSTATTNFILSEMARAALASAEALAEAQRSGYAEADPSDDVERPGRGGEDGDSGAAGFGAPVHLERRPRTRESDICTADDMEYARELGLGLKLIGTAERRDRRACRCGCTRPSCTPGHPLASGRGPVQRRDGRERRRSPRSRCRGRARADRQTASGGAGRRGERDDRRRPPPR